HQQAVGLPIALVPDLGRPDVLGLELGAQRDEQTAGLGGRSGGELMVGGGGGVGHVDCLPVWSGFTLSPSMSATYQLSHLRALEAEAIHIIREVAAEFERPALLFSGGKDSMVMLHLAVKAFAPAKVPFPVVHVDTGHNFDEIIAFRDEIVARFGL